MTESTGVWMLYAASAGLTLRLMSAPFSRSITAISYWLCRSSQNCALLPKYRPSRSAVSAVIERRPLRMSVMRPDGTPRSNARRFALRLRVASSRLKRRPGWATGGMALSFMIIHDLDIVGVALAELEANAPSGIYGHRPLLPAFALELVESHAFQRAEVLQCLRNIERE